MITTFAHRQRVRWFVYVCDLVEHCFYLIFFSSFLQCQVNRSGKSEREKNRIRFEWFYLFALINIRNKMKLKQRTSIYVSQMCLMPLHSTRNLSLFITCLCVFFPFIYLWPSRNEWIESVAFDLMKLEFFSNSSRRTKSCARQLERTAVVHWFVVLRCLFILRSRRYQFKLNDRYQVNCATATNQ